MLVAPDNLSNHFAVPTSFALRVPHAAVSVAMIMAATTASAQAPPVAPPRVAPPAPAISYPSTLPTGRVTYRTLSETYNEMERIAALHPATVKRFELSHRSLLGQQMWGLEITHNVQASSGKPVFLMTGLHHAREWPTVELTMEFVWDVVKSDGVDPRITS